MKDLLNVLVDGEHLTLDQATEAFDLIMTGQATAAQVGAFLAMIQLRGPTIEELVGGAKVMREKASKVQVPDGLEVIDTCGAGGDHTPTFNISTAAAIVVAAIGRPKGIAVAKHGNRTVTRASGSSQGLEALGVKVVVSPETLSRCLQEAGICFCFAPAHHPAMKHAMPIRLELGIRTIFNLLGPLTNPAGTRRQVIGVFRADLTEMLAAVLLKLGAVAAMVVHGKKQDASDGPGFCELSVCGPSTISQLADGQIRTYEVRPSQFGLAPAPVDALLVDSPESSAARIREVLSGSHGPSRDIVCLNAAAALVVADLADDLAQGIGMAREAIDSGAANSSLDALLAITAADKTVAP